MTGLYNEFPCRCMAGKHLPRHSYSRLQRRTPSEKKKKEKVEPQKRRRKNNEAEDVKVFLYIFKIIFYIHLLVPGENSTIFLFFINHLSCLYFKSQANFFRNIYMYIL